MSILLSSPLFFGIRIEFIIFGCMLAGVAIFEKKAMEIVLAGLLSLVLFKFIYDDQFNIWRHFIGNQPVIQQLLHGGNREGEWFVLLNLLGLLLGFSILSKLFELSKLPEKLPAILPDDWTGGLGLLVIVFLMSSILDNIAAAMIGGTMAAVLYKGKVHIGYLAAIIAASNAGGAGSVLGDTTTTLMWIDGVDARDVIHAYVASLTALAIFGIAGSLQQHKYHRIKKDPPRHLKINYLNLSVVLVMLGMAVITNVFLDFPALGIWVVITLCSLFMPIPWTEIPRAMKGTVFLMALVASASLMPVNELPEASVTSAFILGFVSAVFDNIPLTKLCLDQGGYDWGVLAFSVGFGGSMIWFGSSAGVALSNLYPGIRNTRKYLSKSWHVFIAYIIGFWMMMASVGWEPHAPHKPTKEKQIENTLTPEFHRNTN
jgi:Na+/H+ antiporter NhaD/arsenite permease-like protein